MTRTSFFYFYLIFTTLLLVSSCSTQKRNARTAEPSNRKADKELTELYSKKLGIPLDGSENEKLISEVSSWIGTPHKMGSCSKSSVDCSCFVKMVYQQVYGVTLERTSEAMLKNNCKSIARSSLREGDLVFFSTKGGKPSHVGIYLKNSYFVHTSTTRGVMISNLNEPYYQKNYLESGRVAR